jgi:hypothetical protein
VDQDALNPVANQVPQAKLINVYHTVVEKDVLNQIVEQVP